MPVGEKPPCSVCGEKGDGAHFGAEACRACAAFFRRSVALQKVYNCRSQHGCIISSSERCMCRACRYEKCLNAGMKKTAVQRHRDMLGKREGEMTEITIKTDMSDMLVPCVSFNDPLRLSTDYGMPLLSRIRYNYSHLETVRRVIHNRESENVFNKREPRAVAYKEANDVNVREIKLIIDLVCHSFPQFESLPSDQKKLLFGNFYLPFVLLETGYFATQKDGIFADRTDLLFLPSGDYIDSNCPETFYHDIEGKQSMSTEEACRIFAPSFEVYRRNILEPMRRLRVSDYEFFALLSFILWDHGLDNQSEECEAVTENVRNIMTREMQFMYTFTCSATDPACRISSLLVLLPALQRAVRRFQQDVEISHVFNAYSVDDYFYEIVNGRF